MIKAAQDIILKPVITEKSMDDLQAAGQMKAETVYIVSMLLDQLFQITFRHVDPPFVSLLSKVLCHQKAKGSLFLLIYPIFFVSARKHP